MAYAETHASYSRVWTTTTTTTTTTTATTTATARATARAAATAAAATATATATTTTTTTGTTTTRRLSQEFPYFRGTFSRWIQAGSPSALLSDASSDDCARGGDTSSSRSLRPWPRPLTAQPHGDRRRPVPGRRRASCTARPRSGRLLLPSRCSSACTKKSPAGGRPASLAEPPGPQEQAPRRTVEQIDGAVPVVPLLHIFLPKMVDQLVEVLRLIDTVVPDRRAQDHFPRRHPAVRCAPRAADGRTTSLLRKRRRRSSHVWSLSRTSGTLLAASGAGSLVRKGSTAG